MRALVARIAVVAFAVALGSPASSVRAQTGSTPRNAPPSAPEPAASLSFHIPAQPLEKALVAYGLATRIQVLYEARLVAGQQSTAVEGRFPSEQALAILLRGTGLHVRYVTAGTITLAADSTPSREVLVMRTVQIQAPDEPPDPQRFDSFGQALEQRLLEALRQDARTRRRPFDVTLKVWLDPDGRVARTEFVSGAQPGDQAVIADVLRGVRGDQAPPADLPLPISFHFQSRPAY